MTDDDSADEASSPRARTAVAGQSTSGGVLPLVVFTATTFLSALLLFSIQPMFAKMALPVLGGAPSVWAVAMCFFQGALLAGYCYAHLLIAKLPVRVTGFVHLALCLAAFLALPIALPASFGEPPPGDAYAWQLGLFTVAVGLPFMAVAANAPLLQAWYAATGAEGSRDPYFLYAASNLGSLLALLGYPFVLEPAFGLKALSGYWSAGFALLVAAIAVCFVLVRRAAPGDGARAQAAEAGETVAVPPPTWSRRAAWVGLALVPSALLTAFTNHVTTDIASAPLLWVLPLSLYLLTFVIVFRERALIPPRVLLVLHLAAFLIAMFLIAQTRNESWFVSASAGVAVFVTSALVAHRTLYEARPHARYLTEFYLWMSLGGVLGGIFAALVAPQIFSEVFEYPLLLALSMACRPGALDVAKWRDNEGHWVWIVFAAALLMVFWVPWAMGKLGLDFSGLGSTALIVALLAAALIAFFQYPSRQLALALAMFLAVSVLPSTVKRGDALRSFFGVYRVSLSEDGEYNVLTHGTTLHGAQRVRDGDGNPVAETAPGTYYHPKSPMAETIRLRREALGDAKGRYGVVGLGAGSLACLSEEDEKWRFFEIDPVIVDIAARSDRFTYLVNCQPDTDIVLGDARLTLAKEQPGSFDLIIVDAFSSDAVPVHLMTAEALKIYADKLTPDGLAVLHISNRYLDLEAVLAATKSVVPELHGIVLADEEADGSYASTISTVAVFSKTAAALEPIRALPGSSDLKRGTLRPWTDDYSDILGPFLSKLRNR